MRQIQLHIVQKLITGHAHLQWSAHHSAKQLGNVCRIIAHRKGHHRFRTGAIPSGGESFLKENDLDSVIVRNLRCLYMRNMQSIQLDRSVFTEAMDNFALFEMDTSLFLDFCQHVFQICIRKRTAAALAHLHNQHGVHIGIMLLGGILPPACALLQPFLNSCFQQHDVVIPRGIIGIGDDDPIFEQPGAADIICGNHIFLQPDICGISDQGIKPFRRGADTQHNGHGVHFVPDPVFCVFIALDEALHDRCIGACLTLGFRAAMRLVYDKIQPIGFVLNRVLQRFPDRILPIIGMLRQLAASADLLCVQEIDISVLQHFLVEGFLRNGYALTEAQLIRFELDFQLRLRIQLRRIGQPNKDCIRLFLKGASISKRRAKINILDQRGGDDGFPCAGWSLQGNHLRFPPAAIGLQSVGNIHAQFFYGFILEGYQVDLHLAFLPALMRKLSR